MGLALLWSKIKKGKIALSFASPEKEKYFLFIYEVITWGKKQSLPIVLLTYVYTYSDDDFESLSGMAAIANPPPQSNFAEPGNVCACVCVCVCMCVCVFSPSAYDPSNVPKP